MVTANARPDAAPPAGVSTPWTDRIAHMVRVLAEPVLAAKPNPKNRLLTDPGLFAWPRVASLTADARQECTERSN